MQPALESGLFALVGAAVGGTVSTWLTFKLNERTRRLDLYKIFYPKKLEIAQKLSSEGYVLWIEGMAYCRFSQGVEKLSSEAKDQTQKITDETFTTMRTSIEAKLSAFHKMAMTDVFLLEHATLKEAFNLHRHIRAVLEKPQEDTLNTLTSSMIGLLFALRREMNLPTISHLFVDDRQFRSDIKGITDAFVQGASNKTLSQIINKKDT